VSFGASALGRLPCRQLVLYGYASNEDDHTPILDIFFKSLLERDRAWHVAQLFELAVNTPLAGHVSRMLQSDRSHHAVGKLFDTLQVDLSETFEQYLADRFNKKIRYNLKREVRLLETAEPGRVVTKVYTSPYEVADFLHDATQIAQRTYQWKLGFSTINATPRLLRRLQYMARHEKNAQLHSIHSGGAGRLLLRIDSLGRILL
jgi:hypothetical protein